MGPDDVRAFDSLAKHPRLADLTTLTREIARAAAESRKAAWTDASWVTSRAEELKLARDDAHTDFGNALAALERGPEDDAEKTLLRALWAHAIADSRPKGSDDEDKVASEILWLATHTPFDATALLDRALGEDAGDLWKAIADRARRIDKGQLPSLGRGEALVACAAIAASASDVASRQARALAADVGDPLKKQILSGASRESEPAEILGELSPPPRGPVATTALAVTGLLFLISGARLFGRFVLLYRRPAEATLTRDAVRVRTHTEVLGRKLRDREITIPRDGLASVTREVRYPRVGLYAGLLALALGSYVGVTTFVDGLRSASPSLLLTGLVLMGLGVALDFGLGVLIPGRSGRCRVIFVPVRGRRICIGSVDAVRADVVLAQIARKP